MCRSRQQGLGLMSAIFLIVVVAVLVVAIARMVRTSEAAFSQDVMTHRAFLAAETGAQIALNRVFAPVGSSSCASPWTWDLTDVGLANCQATVDCRTETVGGTTHYTVESNGRCNAGGIAAERQILVRATP